MRQTQVQGGQYFRRLICWMRRLTYKTGSKLLLILDHAL
jgi:hypothetical protein